MSEAVQKLTRPALKGSTYFGLLAEFGCAEIPLAECCQKYFDLSPEEAKRRASMHRLPVPAYRAGSQKSPWLVAAEDLAALIDAQKAAARAEHQKMNG